MPEKKRSDLFAKIVSSLETSQKPKGQSSTHPFNLKLFPGPKPTIKPKPQKLESKTKKFYEPESKSIQKYKELSEKIRKKNF